MSGALARIRWSGNQVVVSLFSRRVHGWYVPHEVTLTRGDACAIELPDDDVLVLRRQPLKPLTTLDTIVGWMGDHGYVPDESAALDLLRRCNDWQLPDNP